MLSKIISDIAERTIARFKENAEEYEELTKYIPLNGIINPNDTPTDLSKLVYERVIKNDSGCVVSSIIAEAGSGKTLFSKSFVIHFWEEYKEEIEKGTLPIVLHATLPRVPIPDVSHNLLSSILDGLNISKDAQEQLRRSKHPIFLVCDGYDELKEKVNIFDDNGFDNSPNPIKLIITCRKEAFLEDVQNYFKPHTAANLNVLTIQITPFNPTQIDSYIKQAADKHYLEVTAEEFQKQLNFLPQLHQLTPNPFILRILAGTLPYITKQVAAKCGEDVSKAKRVILTRNKLYETFLRLRFERQTKKILSNYSDQVFAILDRYDECRRNQDANYGLNLVTLGKEQGAFAAIMAMLQDYTERLAKEMFYRNINCIRYEHYHIKTTISELDQFKATKDRSYLIYVTDGVGNKHWYFKGIPEQQKKGKENEISSYVADLANNELCHNLAKEAKEKLQSTCEELGKKSYIEISCAGLRDLGKTITDILCCPSSIPWQATFMDEEYNPDLLIIRQGCPICNGKFIHESIHEYYAAKKIFEGSLVEVWAICDQDLNAGQLKPEIVDQLADIAKQNPEFRAALFNIIELTSYYPRLWKAGANAITILNLAKFVFSDMDFTGARLGGIEILKDGTEKRWGADLSYAVCDGTIFRGCDLSYVILQGALLNNADFTGAMMDGVALNELPRFVMSFDSLIDAHLFDYIDSIFYYNSGKKLAMIGDAGICIWSAETFRILSKINLSNYSTTIGFLLSRGNVKEDVYQPIVLDRFNLFAVRRLVRKFKKEVEVLADEIIKFNGTTDEVIERQSLQGYPGTFYGMVCLNDILYGWFINEGTRTATLISLSNKGFDQKSIIDYGYYGQLLFIVISQNNELAAFIFKDGKLVVYDNRKPTKYMTTQDVYTRQKLVAFSYDNKYLAICSDSEAYKKELWSIAPDKLVVWHLNNLADGIDVQSFTTLEGHNGTINALVFNPQNYLLASASNDKTIRIWDVDRKNNQIIDVIYCCASPTALTFHPSGQILASALTLNTDKMDRFVHDSTKQGKNSNIIINTYPINERNLICKVADVGSAQIKTDDSAKFFLASYGSEDKSLYVTNTDGINAIEIQSGIVILKLPFCNFKDVNISCDNKICCVLLENNVIKLFKLSSLSSLIPEQFSFPAQEGQKETSGRRIHQEKIACSEEFVVLGRLYDDPDVQGVEITFYDFAGKLLNSTSISRFAITLDNISLRFSSQDNLLALSITQSKDFIGYGLYLFDKLSWGKFNYVTLHNLATMIGSLASMAFGFGNALSFEKNLICFTNDCKYVVMSNENFQCLEFLNIATNNIDQILKLGNIKVKHAWIRPDDCKIMVLSSDDIEDHHYFERRFTDKLMIDRCKSSDLRKFKYEKPKKGLIKLFDIQDENGLHVDWYMLCLDKNAKTIVGKVSSLEGKIPELNPILEVLKNYTYQDIIQEETQTIFKLIEKMLNLVFSDSYWIQTSQRPTDAYSLSVQNANFTDVVGISNVVPLGKDIKPPAPTTMEVLLSQCGQFRGRPSILKTPDAARRERNLQTFIPKGEIERPFLADENVQVVTKNTWNISIVRIRASFIQRCVASTEAINNPTNHVYLIIFGIDDNSFTFVKERHFLQSATNSKEGYVKAEDISYMDFERLAKQLIHITWNVPRFKAELLLKNIEEDRNRPLPYNYRGGAAISLYPGDSCVTWCEKHLWAIDIDVPNSHQLLNFIAAFPDSHLPKPNVISPQ